MTPEQVELLAATGFLRTAADGTSTGAADEPLAANQVVADTLKIVGSTLLGLTVGCAQCHDHRYDPIPQADYYRLRAVFEPALDTNHWRRPAQRLVSLFTDADRAKCQGHRGRGREAADRSSTPRPRRTWRRRPRRSWRSFPTRFGPSSAPPCDAAAASRSAEQKRLLASNPSVNITAGVLYQYNQAAADDLKKENAKVAAKRAEKPVEDFVSVLDEVPGVVPETQDLPSRRPSSAHETGPTRRPDDRRARGLAFEIPRKGPLAADLGPQAGLRSTSRERAIIRSSAACWPIGSGSIISAAGWSTRRATSACWARARPIPNCSTGWPTSWSARAGASSACTG